MDYKFVPGEDVMFRPRGEATSEFVVVNQMPEEAGTEHPRYKIKAKHEYSAALHRLRPA